MKVLYIAVECKPFSKAGGVGDVAGELPRAILRKGVDIEIVTPLYGSCQVDRGQLQHVGSFDVHFHGTAEHVERHETRLHGVPITLMKNDTYFEGDYSQVYVHSQNTPFFDDALRFSFFSEACLQLIEQRQPDIVHINDWPLGYLFGRMAMRNMSAKRVLTIHNIGYQGNMSRESIAGWDIGAILDDPRVGPLFEDPHPQWHSINPLRLAIELADRVNTVSPNYCHEITLPEDQSRFFEGGKGLEASTRMVAENGRLAGILNGFEYKVDANEDEFTSTLKRKHECKAALGTDFENPQDFLLGFVGRAVEQKFKLLTEQLAGKSVLEHILEVDGVNLAIVASGLPEYEACLRQIQDRPNVSATIAFDREKAMQISLGSDVFLMPSLFEPCGITQMESLSCATPPLVRWTGGLVDTVRPHDAADGTGFGFDGESGEQVLRALVDCVAEARRVYRDDRSAFQAMQRRGFFERFSWSDAADNYVRQMYEPAVNPS